MTPPSPSNDFIGRGSELSTLLGVLSAHGAVAEIVGPPGCGKSSLVHALADHREAFPGGVLWFARDRRDRSPILVPLREGRGHKLLVIDDTQHLTATELYQYVRKVEGEFPSISTVVTGRAAVGLGQAIHLAGLHDGDFAQLAERLLGDIPPQVLHELATLTNGSPLNLKVLSKAIREGGLELSALRSLVEPFQAAGLIDIHGNPLSTDSAARQRLLTDVTAINDEMIRRAATDPEFLYQLDPRRFEELVAELFSRDGYEVTLTKQTRDGGKDIYAAKKAPFGSLLYIVECKRYAKDSHVGVEVVRSLHGVANAERVNGAVVMTTSYFSSDAKEFASTLKQQMNLSDYVALNAWLTTLTTRI